ncbi:Bifunctional 3-dehydroquinate dehydratase/shikimate dehydrogenase [Cardamine amara subsp. amara]|uniref:shikimate dehydrogenase (NADP(+)) n=1 Tax=Cardamine amara subsp. amara TaxID=228776 RepID=A0ABD1AYM8_CARAN
MAASPTNARLTYPLHVVSNPRLSPTSAANLRFPAADFHLRSNSSLFSAESSSLQTRSLSIPLVFSDRRTRRSMEATNVYVASNSTEMEIGSQEIVKNPSLICAPVMADSIDKMVIETCKAHEVGADLVEIRLDWLKDFNPLEDLKTIIKKSPLPTLFTYRPKWEGGQYEGDENERLDVLRLAMELGADYIDVELQVASEFIKSIDGKKPENFKVIVSSHNYQSTPSVEDLSDLAARIQQAGADIVKIATTAVDIADVARMFHITSNAQVPTIGLVMGERGLMSRILCSKFGGYLTFGTLESGKVSAPGQPTIKELLDLYNFRRIRPDTKVYGIIGKPVSHSKSPIVHNQAFKSVDFNGVYVHLLVDNLASFLQAYSSSDFAGFSCTIPHKEAALQCCDEVDPLAKSIGAVNTILRRQNDRKLLGYNTDCIGSISAIEDGLRRSGDPGSVPSSSSPLAGKTVVVIGAGGAGKALAYGAKEKGAKVVIANRTYERAVELAEAIGGRALSLTDLDNFHPEDGMVLANTTSMGMQPNVDETPISKHALKHYTLVFDAVYTPRITRLLREAEECGAITVSGSEMFVRQAYEQFEIFTGLPAPKELYWQIMSKY